MNRIAVYAPLLVAVGLAAGIGLARKADQNREASAARKPETSAAAPGQRGSSEFEPGGEARQWQRRLELLAARLAAEAAERRRLAERVEGLEADLARLRTHGEESTGTAVAPSEPASGAPAAIAAPGDTRGGTANAADGATPMERALIAAGIDAATATEIKRQEDELALTEIYLRDLASREGWLDSPRFAEEMAEIQQQRVPIRAAIGDDAYDRYLAALDHPNRAAVDEVLLDSPAAVAGLRTGDVVLRYGQERIFSPGDLVAATHGGVAGETVRVEIVRDGQRLEVEVPRGPLGVRVAATRAAPVDG